MKAQMSSRRHGGVGGVGVVWAFGCLANLHWCQCVGQFVSPWPGRSPSDPLRANVGGCGGVL